MSQVKIPEPLELAAKACDARVGTGEPGIDTAELDSEANACANAVRALIK